MLYPTPHNDLLLQACFKPSGEGALRQWEREVDLDGAEPDVYYLLPLLKRHADHRGWQLKDAGRAAGMHRFQLARVSIALQRMNHAVATLHEVEIEPLVIGDAALALRYYPQLGLRAVNELTLVIQPSQQPKAAQKLHQAGWNAHGYIPPHRLRMIDSLRFNFEETLLSLRWSMLDRSPSTDEPFWNRAISLGRDNLRTLSPADHLLYTAASMVWEGDVPLPALRIADACIFLSEQTIDWNVLAESAKYYERIGMLRSILTAAADLGLPPPVDFLERLGMGTFPERLEMHAFGHRLSRQLDHLVRIQRQNRGTSLIRRPVQAVRYFLCWNGVSPVRKTIRRGARRVLRHTAHAIGLRRTS